MIAAPVITSPLDGLTTDAVPSKAAAPAAALPLGWDEPIYIPDPAKRVPLRSFEPSLPTLFFLNRHDFWVAGDLHGRSYPGLRMKSGCDLGIISELRRLVDALQQAHGVSPADIREERQRQQLLKIKRRLRTSVPRLNRRTAAGRTPAEMGPKEMRPKKFTVPDKARSWSPLSLPLSTRMQKILRRCGIRCLGELHDLPFAELRVQGDCGTRSIAELQYYLQLAEAGEVAPAPYRFDVPEKARSWHCLSLPLSTRVQNILHWRGIRCLGELHDLPFAELRAQGDCGARSIAELRHILQLAEAGEVAPAAYNFDVPENIRSWNVSELPLTVRLETVLRNLGIVRVGELHGMHFETLWAARGCGRKTLEKLQQVLARAARGEFAPPVQRAGWQPKPLIQILDALVGFLPDRGCQVFCDRLGAESGEMETLESIARRAGMTRQWVSQVALLCVIRIRKSGSLPLKFHLERLKARCNMAHCALSPDVLGRWLKASSAKPRFAVPFYVRLIARLEPGIKAEGI
jgi:hypothetical protein